MKSMIGVLFVTGLCLTGCAVETGNAADPSDPAESSTSQEVSTGVRCSDKTWRVNFYSDATLTTQVGTMSCVCFQLEQMTGTQTQFTKLAFEFTCDLR